MFEEEIVRFKAWAEDLATKEARQIVLSKVEDLERSLNRLGREPVFRVGGSVSETLAAMNLQAFRRQVAEAEGLPPPLDIMREVKARIAQEKAERNLKEVRRELKKAEAATRRASRPKKEPKSRPVKEKVQPVAKAPDVDPRQGSLL